jgi:glycosyltransferase involved in cell wall biosynthesis
VAVLSERASSPIVTVVLATYQGARFLPEQLESLSSQSRRPDRLVLRDDGSRDQSVEIVRNWAQVNRIDLQELTGDGRLGPSRSFLLALQLSKPADIFFFCDQDDVWLPQKIARALERVPFGEGSPATLLATRLEVVNEQLEHVRLSRLPKHLSFSSASCESLLTGCTMAFNSSFRDQLVRCLPESAAMHDWWCYLLATGTRGVKIHFDPLPTLQYRQHGRNALGAGPTGLVAAFGRARRFLSPLIFIRSNQLREFRRIHGSALTVEAVSLLDQLIPITRQNLFARARSAIFAPIHRQTVFSTMLTRLSLFTERF